MVSDQTVFINETAYKESDLTVNQIEMVNHVADLDKKIQKYNFTLRQLQFGREAFMNVRHHLSSGLLAEKRPL